MESTTESEKRCSYKSRQPKAGPAPFASFEDLSDCLEESSPEEIVPLPEILEEDNVPSYGSGSGSGSTYTRTRDSKRESITTVISPEYEREILQRNRDLSVTFGFKEGGSTQDLRRSADELENQTHFRRDSSHRSSIRSNVGSSYGPVGPFVNYNFRMIDAGSKESLMDLERRRRESTTSSIFAAETGRMDSTRERDGTSAKGTTGSPTSAPPLISRMSSISSSSSGLRSNSPHTMLIESSFCGPKPIPTPSLDMVEETISLSSEDGVERDLIEEINARTKFPLTKQDSYGHAIYHGAKKGKNVKKQGSYEAAVESGVHKDLAMRRTKRILKIRKQDSYTRAIGGSFEDEHSLREERRKERESGVKMRKQDSYLRAVGEVSPDTESNSESLSDIGFRKQDSYIEAIRSTSPVDEVPELPSRSKTSRRTASYLQEAQEYQPSSERATFRIGDDDRKSPRHSPKTSPRRSPITITTSNGTPKQMKKQDSYTMAIEEESDPEDYIDKEINRKIALKRTETVKTVVKECINENDDILFRIKRRTKAEQEAMKKMKVDKENVYNEKLREEDANANIQINQTKKRERVDNMYENVIEEFKKKSPNLKRKNLTEIENNLNEEEANAAVVIQSVFKGYKIRKELEEMKAFHRHMSQPIHEELSPRPENKNADGIKRRQNSYLEAVCSPPDSFADEPTKRPWKTRQESYAEAINHEENSNKPVDWQNRQNSYLQAVGASIDVITPGSVQEQTNGKSTKVTKRQDSYQKAISSVSPNTSISEDSRKDPRYKKRQDSYQKAIESLSDKSKSISEPAYKKRQPSYQKAISDTSTISESVNQKNIKNNKNKEKKEAVSQEKKKESRSKQNQQETQIGDKLSNWVEKKQSRSPRRRPEAYQRPPSTSSDEDEIQATHKRTHKPRGTTKKNIEKVSDSVESRSSSGGGILKFSQAADVVNAAIKIQGAYRGYRARCEIREHHDSLDKPDIQVSVSNKRPIAEDKQPVRKAKKQKPPHRAAWADVVNAVITIQRAYRKYRRNKILLAIDVDDCDKAEAAIVKIQAHYKGFQTRKAIADKKPRQEMSKANTKQSSKATKIEKKKLPQSKLNTSKIAPLKDSKKVPQTKTVQKREPKPSNTIDASKHKVSSKVVKQDNKPKKRPLRTETYVVEDPYLKKAQAAKVAAATLRIQSWYRGYKARKEIALLKSQDSEEYDTGTIKRGKKKSIRKESSEELPDLDDSEVNDATIKIQAAYKGFKARQMVKRHKEILPDLNCAQVQDATIKIQSAYRGFQTRKRLKEENEELPDLNAADVVAATIAIQSAYRGFKTRKMIESHREIMPDLNCAQVQDATIKIQSAFRGFKTRKQLQENSDLPDLRADDVAAATIKIQAAYKGFKTRQMMKQHKEIMPDLNCAQVKDATIKIQSAYRGFRTRKELQESGQELPNLKAADVVAATIKIQSAYKGFKARQMIKQHKDMMPDLNCAQVQDATLKIQSAYRGFKTRKDLRESGQDLPDLKASDVAAATIKIQSAYKGFKTRKHLKIQADQRAKQEAELRAKEEIRAKQEAVMKAKQDAIRARKIKEKEHPKEPMVLRQRHEPKQLTPKEPVRTRQRHESQAQHSLKKIEDVRKEEDMKIKKETVSFFGRFMPSTNSKGAQSEATLPKSSPNQTQSRIKEFNPQPTEGLPKTKIIPKRDTKTMPMQPKAPKVDVPGKKAELHKKKSEEDELPDLKDIEVAKATVKIQSAYRGFQTRKALKAADEELPNLKAADVVAATIKIQAAYKGFRTRQMVKQHKEVLPDLNCAQVQEATVKIQSAYRGFKTRKHMKESCQDLPDLKASDVVAATIKIQSAYKGFKTRQMIKKHKEVLPDLNCAQVQDATVKIQSAYRGFKTRKQLKADEELPDLNAADVVAATIKIQSAYKGFRTRQMIKSHKEILPDLNCAQVQDATIKIQSAYRGFKTRKELRKDEEEMPDLKAEDVIAATVKIQSAFKGYKARKMVQQHKELMPDLNCAQVQDATIKIQSAYRGFKTRKDLKETEEDLPDLKAADVAEATIKIQAAYKGFKTRQMIKKHKEVLPDLNCAQVQDATLKIQSAYRGFRTRKELKDNGQDLPDLKAADVVAATIKIQSAYRGFQTRKSIEEKEKQKKIQKERELKEKQAAKEIRPKVETKLPQKEKESSSGFFSRFMPTGNKEQPTVKASTESKTEEKKSIFGFFGRTSSQKEILPEKKINTSPAMKKNELKNDTAISKSRSKESSLSKKEFNVSKNNCPSVRKTDDNDLPNLKDSQVQDATIKIQSAYRGFKTRRELKESGQDLPDLKAQDVVAATIKIQAAYKGFKTRQMVIKHKEIMPDLNCAQVQDATIKIQSAYRGFKTRKQMKNMEEDLPDLNAADVAAAAIKIQSAYKGFQTRKMIRKHKEVLPDLNCAQVQDATIKIQSAYRGFKTRKQLQESGEDLPNLKCANVVGATLKIQAYYRGFKVRKAIRDQEARQKQAEANISEAAIRLRVLPMDRSKKLLKNTPKTPMHSFDLRSSPSEKQQRPSVPPSISFPEKGQRIKKSVPQFVDERDSKRIARKPMGQAPESVQEDQSQEFTHHPADVVYAAMTIQRFFKTIKARKQATKVAKRYDSTTTESSAEDSSNYDPSQSDSSETDTQVKRGDSDSRESSESSETESDEESRRTVRFDSIKRRKVPPKASETEEKKEIKDSPQKKLTPIKKKKSSSETSDSESDTEKSKFTTGKRNNSTRTKTVESKDSKDIESIKQKQEVSKNDEPFQQSKKESEGRGGVFGFFGAGRTKELKQNEVTKVNEQTNQAIKKAETENTVSEPKAGVMGFFKQSTNKEQKDNGKADSMEKSSVFSFFGRSSAKKEAPMETKKEIKQPMKDNVSVSPSVGRQKSSEAQKMSIITTFRGGDLKPRKSSDEELPDLTAPDVAAAAVKIQSAYKGFKTRKYLKENNEDLPDLKAKDVVEATIRIQSAYKGFKTRQMIKKHKEVLPDLNCAEVKDATLKIQSAYRGFKTRKDLKESRQDLPDLKAADVVAATIKIQSAYKGFKTRRMIKQHKEIMPDLNCAQVQDATLKIQSAYRGFKTRKELKESGQDLPDLKAADVVAATIKIQSAYKGFKTRQMVKKHKEILPDLNCAQVQDATLKIQSAYRGFKARKELKQDTEDLPDLRAADVVAATIKIQSVYKGFKTRQMIKEHKEILPDLNCAQVKDATIKIQSAYSGFKTRKELKEAGDDLPDIRAADVINATIRIQSAYKGFKTRKMIKKHKEILPDLNCAQVQDATVKIQSAYRGFKTRQELQQKVVSVSDSSDSSEPESQRRRKDSSESSATESEDEIKKPTRVSSVRRAQGNKTRTDRQIIPESSATESDAIESMPDTDVDDEDRAYVPKSRVRVPDSSATESEAGDDLPDLDDSDVENATIKIQSAFRGFQARKNIKTSIPAVRRQRFADVVGAAITIQRAYRRYKKKKEERKKSANIAQQRRLTSRTKNSIPGNKTNLPKGLPKKTQKRRNLQEVAMAAVTIQKAFRRYKIKKEQQMLSRSQMKSGLPSQHEITRKIVKRTSAHAQKPQRRPNMADVVQASITIQRAYRRYKKRKEERRKSNKYQAATKLEKHGMSKSSQGTLKRQKSTPKFSDVVNSTITIQRTFRSYKKRKLGEKQQSNNKSPLQKILGSSQDTKSSRPRGTKQRPELKKHQTFSDVVLATRTIQKAYRRYKIRRDAKKNELEDLPNLDSREVLEATVKIQSAYKGFQTRKMIQKHKEILPDLNCAQVQDATVKIQSAYRGFKTRKALKESDEDLPDLNAADVAAAAVKIQSAYKGFKTRRTLKETHEDLPNLKAADVVEATIKIQSAYKGFKTRKMIKAHKEDMPNLNCAQVQDATVKIQAAYRGFQTRKQMKQNDDLPDLNDKELEEAAIKIQSAFKGFQVRKDNKTQELKTKSEDDDLPDLCDQETLAAALKIQSAFKGYQVRKIHKKVPFTPQPSIDFDNMSPSDLTQNSQKSSHSKRFPPVPQRFDSHEMQKPTKSTSSNVPNDFGVKETPKSPLPARSSRLKEVAIPTVPPPSSDQKSGFAKQDTQSSISANTSESESKDEHPGFLQQSLLRKESLQNFFKKQSEPSSPITPPQPTEERERGRKESLTRAFKEAGETIRSRSKSKEKQKKDLSLPQKEKEEQTKSKIGGFFSSMFKSKSKQKPTTPTDPISPDMKAMSNIEFRFDETSESKSQDHMKNLGGKHQRPGMKPEIREDLIKSASPKGSSSDADSRRSDRLSRTSSKEDDIASASYGSQLKHSVSPISSKQDNRRRMSQESKDSNSKPSISSASGAKSKLRQVASPDINVAGTQGEMDDPNLKKDLIHVVLSAVEENWLNQAPKPTLDKVAALQAVDSDPELENSERSTSEADYVKKKMKAQKSEDLNSDDEGAQLCKQESADGGDLPYVETTLPQERSGIVAITPSSQRLSQCKLTSTERPRSSSPRKPGNLSQYVNSKEKADQSKEPLTVKLPRQESRSKMKPKAAANQQSWDKFSAAGLQSPKQVRKNAQPKPERKKKEPPKSMNISQDISTGKPEWIDCESLPEKKKQPKKYESTEPMKSPSDTSRVGLQTPTGTQIVSPEECSCDCHHESPPQTLTRNISQMSRGMLRSSMTAVSTSSSGSSSRPVPCAASRKRESPPTYKKADTVGKGAVPKSTKRSSGPPTPPIRTSSAVKSTKQISATRGPSEVPTSHTRATRTKSEQSEKVVRRVTQEGRAIRRRDEAKRESLAKRSSTISSDD